MITLLLVMQRASLCYYTIITYYYVIITPCSIITHYYLFQSPELADDLPSLPSLSPSLSFCPPLPPPSLPSFQGLPSLRLSQFSRSLSQTVNTQTVLQCFLPLSCSSIGASA